MRETGVGRGFLVASWRGSARTGPCAGGRRAAGRGAHLPLAVLLCLVGLWTAGTASAATLLVWPGSPSPSTPFANWSTAARTIQAAVDAAQAGDTVLVTNGIYSSGTRVVYGQMANRVAVTKPVTVRSVNGPQVTVIQGSRVPGTTNGDGAVRGVYLTNGAVLSGFTITNGATRALGHWEHEQSGGGVWCATATARLTNCTLSGNSAYAYGGGTHDGTLSHCTLTGNSALMGGGADSSTLDNCVLRSNSADLEFGAGGGAYSAILTHCALTANVAEIGGGADSSVLDTCTLAGNMAASNGGGASESALDNCTLTGNTAHDFAGGVEGSTLNHCTLAGNSALNVGGGAVNGVLNQCTLVSNLAGAGGGGYWATFNNCLLTGNSAVTNGGGTSFGTLSNCTLVGNAVTGASGQGGGAYNGTLDNCILYYNQGASGSNYFNSTLNNCCATPAAGGGTGNITAEPLLVDWLKGNFRLQSNSPCVNAGANTYAAGSADLDGRPRVVGGTVDIGAYEYQGPGFSRFIPWLGQYGLPTDGSADYTDPDGDGLNNWQEWLSGTDPTNAQSVLRLLQPTHGLSGVAVCWESVTNRAYFLKRSTNLAGTPAFQLLASGLPGRPGTTTYTDTNAYRPGPVFYRVGTQP